MGPTSEISRPNKKTNYKKFDEKLGWGVEGSCPKRGKLGPMAKAHLVLFCQWMKRFKAIQEKSYMPPYGATHHYYFWLSLILII